MIICEFEFEHPDTDNPNYSMTEVDYYAWIPIPKMEEHNIENHRLSLRKNLVTNKYEVYRRFEKAVVVLDPGLLVMTGEDTGREEVAFESESLVEVIKFAGSESGKFHGEKEDDEVCTHEYPKKSSFCRGR